jgi:hypothetical protein
MTIDAQIREYIAGQPEPKRRDLEELHSTILRLKPDIRLWFLDGRDETGKTVSNPNVGYGVRTMHYADGRTKHFYQVGLSANTTGISVYILGVDDKTYLARTYGKSLGKATITGYLIRFKTLADIDADVLKAALQFGLEPR